MTSSISQNNTLYEDFSELDDKYESIHRILDEEIDIPFHMVIGGGAIRDFIFGLEPKDLDIYLIPKENTLKFLYQARNILLNKVSCYNVIDEPQLEQALDLLNEGKNFTVKIMDAFKKGIESEDEGHIPLQFLYKGNIGSPQELVDIFDLNICQFGYDGSTILQGSQIDLNEVKKVMFEGGDLRLMNPCSTYSRIKKFKDRYGCRVKEAAKDLKKAMRSEEPWQFLGVPKRNHSFVYGLSSISVLDEKPKKEVTVEDYEKLLSA